MKKLTSIILTLILGCQCLVNMGILSYYQLNKEYIAEVLCINREKPDLDCGGKCFLTEKLNQANQEEENDGPVTQQEKIEIPSFLISRYFFQFHTFLIQPEKISLSNKHLFVHFDSLGVFHPPKAWYFSTLLLNPSNKTCLFGCLSCPWNISRQINYTLSKIFFFNLKEI